MELYLDSANLQEIEEAFKLGFLTGLTTTPTFMHREGVQDVDSLILKLAKIVPILQIEALGETAEEVYAEAKRQLDMGLDIKKTVIPRRDEFIKQHHQNSTQRLDQKRFIIQHQCQQISHKHCQRCTSPNRKSVSDSKGQGIERSSS